MSSVNATNVKDFESRTLAPVAQDTGKRTPGIIWLLIALFLLINIPPAAKFIRYFGDERFYSDGAIEMAKKNEFMVPMDGDGGYFFNKPVLTFWMIIASYKVLGVSLLTTRLPFLLAGCVSLWLTYKLSFSLFQRKGIALIATATLAGNVLFMRESSFSITDAVLTLAMLISHYGFTQILLNRRKSELNYACAYLGCCLGFGIKGILGFMPVVMAYAFTLWRTFRSRNASADEKENEPALRDLIHLPMMLMAGFIIFGWFTLMWCIYGQAFTSVFFADQFAQRLHDSEWRTNWIYYPSRFVVYFLPWYVPLLVLAIKDRRALGESFRRHKNIFTYLLGFVLLMCIFYLPGNLARSRYVLPAFPFFGIFLSAWTFLSCDATRLSHIWKRTAIVFAVLLLVAGVFTAAFGGIVDHSMVMGGIYMAAISGVFLLILFRGKFDVPYATAIFTMLIISVIDCSLLQPFNDLPVENVAAILQTRREPVSQITLVGRFGNDFTPQFHEAIGSIIPVMYSNPIVANARQPQVMVFTQNEQPELALEKYEVIPAGSAYRNKVQGDPDHRANFFEYIRFWAGGKGAEYLDACKLKFFVAIRKQA